MKHERITVEFDLQPSEPYISGTKITVKEILGKLASGASQEDVLQMYPELTREDLHAVFAFAQESIITQNPAAHEEPSCAQPEDIVQVRPQALMQEVDKYKHAREILACEHNLLRTVIDHLPSEVYIKDTKSRFVLANPATLEALQIDTLEDLLGKSDFDLWPEEEAARYYADEQRIIETGEPLLNQERNGIDPAGNPWCKITSKLPLHDAQGNITGIVGLNWDIRERKQVEKELYRYREHLEDLVAERTAELTAANIELDAFAHTVAHDLKNPLTKIIGFASLLVEDGPDQEDTHELLQIILRSARNTVNIVNELLLLSSVRKMDTMVIKPLNMGNLIDSVLERLSHHIEARRATIIPPDCATWPAALGYAPWVEEIWANYLSNAIKYGGTPQAPPCIEMGAVREGEQVRFWVRDHGPGIAPADQDKLFITFKRLGNVRVEGHGLGLSIVQRIAEKLDGSVSIESAPGKGSTFSFTLPAAL